MDHIVSGRALTVNWAADELPDGQGSRLVRDVGALQQEDPGGLSYGLVVNAARWAPRENPLVVADDDRLIDWAIEDNHHPPYLRVEIAVEPVTTGDLPSNWRGWSIGRAGRVISPELPSVPEETVLSTRTIVGRLFVPEPSVPSGDVRRMLDASIAQLDTLAQDALERLVLKT